MDVSKQLGQTLEVLREVAKVGRKYPSEPALWKMSPFASYFDKDTLVEKDLDRRDGGVTRREALLRALLVSAVIDQGPDIEGVRQLAVRVVNDLYGQEVRIFHRPLDFFEHFHISATSIEECHAVVKKARAAAWAKQNNSKRKNSYLLYMENAKQTLGYAVYRWGAPLILPLMLQHEATARGEKDTSEVLYKFLRDPSAAKFHDSIEGATHLIKSHERYGLGKAIGDKAAHLFGKWVVHSFPLLLRSEDSGWGPWSYEVPFDSNAGRVLYRTGVVTDWVDKKSLTASQTIQIGKGKDAGTAHMRVTNLRGVGVSPRPLPDNLVEANKRVCVDHLRVRKRGTPKVAFQQLPSAIALLDGKMTPGQIDDGLIRVGTKWCTNTGKPKCRGCPLRSVCQGVTTDPRLISAVRT